MVNYIWGAMFIIGYVFALINGKMEAVNTALFKAAGMGVTISLGLMSVLIFWLGLMRIAEESGLLAKMANLFRPLITRLFPDVPPDHPALGYILSNMMANTFGLGNAATPLGIKAMEQLKSLNGGRDEASRSMITFLAINTSSITLIPTTVIALRMSHHSANPTDIVITTLLATTVSMIGGILIDRYFYKRRSRKGRR
ncbi:nucleoside recognition domain-containing protein [Bacillus testis]|uniref:nucleoside recognition domain-containing protein n=1 Tax=Bacillus testis TaxID=1622072 RepID=UPI00067F1E1E|nr:nucleoside recognition domain-containing protein [Bacillus testis]